ncbi:MAG: hypothetical protein CMJ64_13520 [Planctomycetaceae bacterium]|nr:hypothetical protein [Planctomycetaceae bacterium]
MGGPGNGNSDINLCRLLEFNRADDAGDFQLASCFEAQQVFVLLQGPELNGASSDSRYSFMYLSCCAATRSESDKFVVTRVRAT